jgi:hypothetical protein
MNQNENDPDTLQLLDESDDKWVRRWRRVLAKKTEQTDFLTIICPLENKVHPQLSK